MNTEQLPRTAEERPVTCLIGGTPYYGNLYEHIACRIEKGTPIRFSRERLSGVVKGTGTVRYSWCYDGINLAVDDGTKDGCNLMLTCGDTFEVLEDAAELNLPAMHGDGI